MEVGVFAFIKSTEGNVLFVKDATREEKWTLPGGGPDPHELIPACLEREVKEETSLEVRIGEHLGTFTQQKTPGIVILMSAERIKGTPTPDGKETSECRYFSLDELLAIRDKIKPAQLSMVWQILRAEPGDLPIYNHFVPPPQAETFQ